MTSNSHLWFSQVGISNALFKPSINLRKDKTTEVGDATTYLKVKSKAVAVTQPCDSKEASPLHLVCNTIRVARWTFILLCPHSLTLIPDSCYSSSIDGISFLPSATNCMCTKQPRKLPSHSPTCQIASYSLGYQSV